MKWVAAGLAAVVIVLIILLREVTSPSADARPADPPPPPEPTTTITRSAPALKSDPPTPVHNMGSIEIDESADNAPIKKFSDEFWERVDEVYARKLIGIAAPCYKGGLNRKKKMKVSYKYTVEKGWVTLRDVRMTESNLGDPALEKCIVAAITDAKFQDGRMPDWMSADNDEETLVVRIMLFKRFMPGQTDGEQN